MTKRIVIVDDQRHVGTLLAHTLDDLQDADVVLDVIDDPERALEHVSSNRPDLVLVDADMAVMSGVEFCRALRKSLPQAQIVIVLLSEVGQEPSDEIRQELQLFACVAKPFDPDRIRALACEALGFEFDG